MALLVPIDLSEPSRFAIEVAARMCPVVGEAQVVLLHVVDGAPELDLLAALHRAAEPLRAAGVSVSLRAVEGDPVEQICLQATRRECRWVIMGVCGEGLPEGGHGRAGRVAEQVLERSTVPVAAVWRGRGDPATAGWRLCERCRQEPRSPGCASLVDALERTVRELAAHPVHNACVGGPGRLLVEAEGPVVLVGGGVSRSAAGNG